MFQHAQVLAPLLDGPATSYPRFILVDLEEVTGFDSSCQVMFHKLSRKGGECRHNVTVYWSGIRSDKHYERLKRWSVLQKEVTFDNIDKAVEWCEDEMLAFSQVALSSFCSTPRDAVAIEGECGKTQLQCVTQQGLSGLIPCHVAVYHCWIRRREEYTPRSE